MCCAGAGKTLIAAEVIRAKLPALKQQGKAVLFLAPTNPLVAQVRRTHAHMQEGSGKALPPSRSPCKRVYLQHVCSCSGRILGGLNDGCACGAWRCIAPASLIQHRCTMQCLLHS